MDILPSSRHVRVEIDGVTIAESNSPRLLFETGLPVRFPSHVSQGRGLTAAERRTYLH